MASCLVRWHSRVTNDQTLPLLPAPGSASEDIQKAVTHQTPNTPCYWEAVHSPAWPLFAYWDNKQWVNCLFIWNLVVIASLQSRYKPARVLRQCGPYSLSPFLGGHTSSAKSLSTSLQSRKMRLCWSTGQRWSSLNLSLDFAERRRVYGADTKYNLWSKHIFIFETPVSTFLIPHPKMLKRCQEWLRILQAGPNLEIPEKSELY